MVDPLDGGYSEWSSWSKCLATCGGGVQERFRKCSHPTPAFGGLDCRHIGPALESRECNNFPCPSKFSPILNLMLIKLNSENNKSIERAMYLFQSMVVLAVGVLGLNAVLVVVVELPPDHACAIILHPVMAAKIAVTEAWDLLLSQRLVMILLVEVLFELVLSITKFFLAR